jgi:hypothetical protein
MGAEQGKYRRNNGDKLAGYNALDTASPDSFCVSNMGRFHASDPTIAIATTGKLTLSKITFGTGEPVTNLSFVSGSTAGATMTSWWLALYTPAGALMAQTADQVAGAIAANTLFTIALATPQRIKEGGLYRIGICIAAATVPTLVGVTVPPPIVGPAEGVGSEETTTTYTTTAPATLPALTARRGIPYFVAS